MEMDIDLVISAGSIWNYSPPVQRIGSLGAWLFPSIPPVVQVCFCSCDWNIFFEIRCPWLSVTHAEQSGWRLKQSMEQWSNGAQSQGKIEETLDLSASDVGNI